FDAANFPVIAGRLLGSGLATLHKTLPLSGLGSAPGLAWLHRGVPWVMQVHKPGPGLLATISPANYQTLRILQTQEDLSQRLDVIKKMWQPKCVIHGDIKSDNILLVAPGGETNALGIRLVDWETIQIGDPAWDVAGALQDFILFWISSMPVGIGSPDEMVRNAMYPLASIQAAIRAFWRAYRGASALTQAEADALLIRAVQFSAARLIQSAYEIAQNSQVLPATSVLILQIGSNILAGPEMAQVQLFGVFQEVSVQ
ncbi:MAG: phosphotransferase, partial [Blastocatellia bacterium]